jgi:hypothetical protein
MMEAVRRAQALLAECMEPGEQDAEVSIARLVLEPVIPAAKIAMD